MDKIILKVPKGTTVRSTRGEGHLDIKVYIDKDLKIIETLTLNDLEIGTCFKTDNGDRYMKIKPPHIDSQPACLSKSGQALIMAELTQVEIIASKEWLYG